MYYYKLFLCLLFLPAGLWAQSGEVSLTLEQSVSLMNKGNRTLQMADKAVGIARSERQKMNSFGIHLLMQPELMYICLTT